MVRYRGRNRATARLLDPQSVASEARGPDGGTRGTVRNITAPRARTSEDCQNAALALLDDATQIAWSGEYTAWSDLLAGRDQRHFSGGHGRGPCPSSRSADFSAIVRTVEIDVSDLESERTQYRISFANDAAELLALELELPSGYYSVPDPVSISEIPPPPAASPRFGGRRDVRPSASTGAAAVDTFKTRPAGEASKCDGAMQDGVRTMTAI